MNQSNKSWLARAQYEPDEVTKELLKLNDKSPSQVIELLRYFQSALPSFGETFSKALSEHEAKKTYKKLRE